VTLSARWVTLRGSLGDAKSSLGDAKSSLGDAKSSLGDAKSSLGDAESSLGDAKSSPGDAKSSLGDAKSSLGDAKSSQGDVQGVGGWWRTYRAIRGVPQDVQTASQCAGRHASAGRDHRMQLTRMQCVAASLGAALVRDDGGLAEELNLRVRRSRRAVPRVLELHGAVHRIAQHHGQRAQQPDVLLFVRARAAVNHLHTRVAFRELGTTLDVESVGFLGL
jgi:hypothetical protein